MLFGQMLDSYLGQCSLHRRNKIGAIVYDTDIGIDLERDCQIVVGVVSETGNIPWNPPAVTVDWSMRRLLITSPPVLLTGRGPTKYSSRIQFTMRLAGSRQQRTSGRLN